MDDLIDIGEVRARTGLPASTLHYYERHGLTRSVRDDQVGCAVFAPVDALDRRR